MGKTVSQTLRLGIARPDVFRLWTTADGLSRWIGPQVWKPFASVDLRLGGAYRMGMVVPQMGEIATTGEFVTLVPNERLVFTWHWEGSEEPVTQVQVDFLDVEGGTELRLEHTGFGTDEEHQNHVLGWNDWLNRLEKLCEAGV